MVGLLFVLCACLLIAGGCGDHGLSEAGNLVTVAPRQGPELATSLDFRGATLHQRHHYAIDAMVLGKRPYSDRMAGVIPLDLALGWGRMSDPDYVAGLAITQGERRYYYQWYGEHRYSPDTITHSSANVHIIPADESVAATALALRKGQLIHAEGYLVDVVWDDGYRIETSTTRGDTRDGSCEVFYVTELSVRDP